MRERKNQTERQNERTKGEKLKRKTERKKEREREKINIYRERKRRAVEADIGISLGVSRKVFWAPGLLGSGLWALGS